MRNLHIYPTWHPDYVQVVDSFCATTVVRSRDLVFQAFDLIKCMYDDVILHADPR